MYYHKKGGLLRSPPAAPKSAIYHHINTCMIHAIEVTVVWYERVGVASLNRSSVVKDRG